jgi:hypothetical protein
MVVRAGGRDLFVTLRKRVRRGDTRGRMAQNTDGETCATHIVSLHRIRGVLGPPPNSLSSRLYLVHEVEAGRVSEGCRAELVARHAGAVEALRGLDRDRAEHKSYYSTQHLPQ